MPLPKKAKAPRDWARAALLRAPLLALLARTDQAKRLEGDPLGLVRERYREPLDLEVAALLAAAVAYGRVDLFRPRLATLFDALGAHPGALARGSTLLALQKRCGVFHYRMTGPDEVAALLFGAGRLSLEHGSLGAAFGSAFREAGEPTVRGGLGLFLDRLLQKSNTNGAPPSRRLKHLLPDPRRGSACKRLNLFLRWMVRGPDAVDYGMWKEVPKRALVIPLDTHVHRIGRFLGLTRRSDLSWATAEEVTARLREIDPEDPVRFDFALSHWGISGNCPVRRAPVKCAACPLQPVCAQGQRG